MISMSEITLNVKCIECGNDDYYYNIYVQDYSASYADSTITSIGCGNWDIPIDNNSTFAEIEAGNSHIATTSFDISNSIIDVNGNSNYST